MSLRPNAPLSRGCQADEVFVAITVLRFLPSHHVAAARAATVSIFGASTTMPMDPRNGAARDRHAPSGCDSTPAPGRLLHGHHGDVRRCAGAHAPRRHRG